MISRGLINQERVTSQGAGSCSGLPPGAEKKTKSWLSAGREAGGEECDESGSETFSPTVLIGSIFRLQYLAGPITQSVFPHEDTNDLANLFYGVKLDTIYKLKRFPKMAI